MVFERRRGNSFSWVDNLKLAIYQQRSIDLLLPEHAWFICQRDKEYLLEVRSNDAP